MALPRTWAGLNQTFFLPQTTLAAAEVGEKSWNLAIVNYVPALMKLASLLAVDILSTSERPNTHQGTRARNYQLVTRATVIITEDL